MKNIPGYVGFIGLALFLYGVGSLGLRGEDKPVSKTSKYISIGSILAGIIIIILWGMQPAK